jgi:amidase
VSPEGYVPNPGRLALYRSEAKYPTLDDPTYRAAQTHGMAFVRETLQAIFDKEKLDAIVYPTNPRRPAKIGEEPPSGSAERPSATNFANLSGFPDLIVPAGFTSTGLPVGISFFGPAFSEPKLLALGYSYEQATQNLRVPVHAKPLPGETITY